jgi:hypothetical protein
MPLVDPSGFADWPNSGDPRLDQLRRRIENIQHRRRRGTWIAGFALGPLIVGALVLAATLLPTLPQAMVVAALVLVIGPCSLLLAALASRDRPEIYRAVLSEGLCPPCGYNLYGLAPAADGCIECPECGAAWNARYIRRAAPLAAAHPATVQFPGSQALRMLGDAISDGLAARDDRGAPIAVVRPRLQSQLRSASPELRQRLRSARRRYSRAGALLRIALAALFTAQAGAAFILWLLMPPVAGRHAILIGVLTGAAIAAGVFFGNFGYSARTILRVMKLHALCPSCASDLDPVAPEPDGCRLCPTCLAAWRLPGPAMPALSSPLTSKLV